MAIGPFRFSLVAVTGWMNRRQLHSIECLREENRVLIEQLGERRMRLTNDERQRLAANVEGAERKLPARVVTNVTQQRPPSRDECQDPIGKPGLNEGPAPFDRHRERISKSPFALKTSELPNRMTESASLLARHRDDMGRGDCPLP